MYQPIKQHQECSVSIATIDSAFDDINANSIELTKTLNSFGPNSTARDAQNILTQTSVLIGYMISLRNQLLILKRQSSIAGGAQAKEYLNELKVQMDGLKSITYSYGAIYSALHESNKLDQKLL
jgi:hypothetical protein